MARTTAPRRAPRQQQKKASRATPRQPGAILQYKVVELSTVDEGTLEHAINEWTRKGWHLDGVQFAMRESSKRPSMAFVFFTRDVPDAGATVSAEAPPEARMEADARTWETPTTRESDPWTRLRRLASDEDDEGGAT